MIFKSTNKKKWTRQAGMTYVELIVVLSIFSVISGVVLFGYRDFGRQIALENLSQDVALQIVAAQKSAINGQLAAWSIPDWRPSYGVFFDTANNTQFVPFIDDVLVNKMYDTPCDLILGTVDSYGLYSNECMNLFTMHNGNYIQSLLGDDGSGSYVSIPTLAIDFTRPDSSAYITDNGIGDPTIFTKAEIVLANQDLPNVTRTITVYNSGRIEVN